VGLGDWEEGGVELDEGGVDGGVLGVAGITGGGGRGHFGCGQRACGAGGGGWASDRSGFEAEEGPVALRVEAGFVFEVDFEAHEFGVLEIAGLVDGTFAFGAADFEDKHGFVGPRAGLQESLVGFGIHKNIIEHVVVHIHGGGVAHVEASGDVDPLAIVGGETELAVGGVRGGVGGECRLAVSREGRPDGYRDYDEQNRFGFHDVEFGGEVGGREDRWLHRSVGWLQFAGSGWWREYDAERLRK
jgi:hypothetical protein